MSSEPQVGEFELNQAVQLLSATPATLRALLGHLSPEWLQFQEEPEAWSPHSVMIHMIHNDRTNWIVRARTTLKQGGPHEFPPFQQMPDELHAERSIDQLLDEFAAVRGESLAELQGFGLGSDAFDRPAIHPELGTVNLRQLLSTWVVHDMNHIHQIVKSLAKRYTAEVGPWTKFLAILEL